MEYLFKWDVKSVLLFNPLSTFVLWKDKLGWNEVCSLAIFCFISNIYIIFVFFILGRRFVFLIVCCLKDYLLMFWTHCPRPCFSTISCSANWVFYLHFVPFFFFRKGGLKCWNMFLKARSQVHRIFWLGNFLLWQPTFFRCLPYVFPYPQVFRTTLFFSQKVWPNSATCNGHKAAALQVENKTQLSWVNLIFHAKLRGLESENTYLPGCDGI